MKNLKKQERPLMLKVMGKWFKMSCQNRSDNHDTQEDHLYCIIIISIFSLLFSLQDILLSHFVDINNN